MALLTRLYSESKHFSYIVSCRDPQANEVFVDSLPWDRNFIRNLYSMLADDGIIIMQFGKAPNSDYSSEMVDNVLLWLEDVGIESFHQYENVGIKYQMAISPPIIYCFLLLIYIF